MKTIKVLIVDDSAFMRTMITDILNEDHRIHVIGTAYNGADAVIKINKLKPDVVTMDVEMPIMSGLEVLKKVMKEAPVPIVMLSSTTKDGAENTLQAMQYGAVDFITKPSSSTLEELRRMKGEITHKVVIAAKANIRLMTRLDLKPAEKRLSYNSTKVKHHSLNETVICIGTSTGGPRALQQVLTKLPKSINAPILIVQHMPPKFTHSLANRLNTLCDIEVKEAEDSEILLNGTAYIAPGGYHMKVKKIGKSSAIKIVESESVNGHRPSVDVLFESVGQMETINKIAVIMTGMGADGRNGLIEMKKSGNTFALAESKETSIVFGMPKAAIATGHVDQVLPIDDIAAAIVDRLKS